MDPIVPFALEQISLIRRVLSVAETGFPEWNPASVYVYADDSRFNPPRKQITLSIGFTEGGGNLKRVLERYSNLGGNLAAAFGPYLPQLGNRSQPTRANDPKFMELLRKAGKEPAMVQAQTESFDRLYLEPAFVWAAQYGFNEALSYLVISDSFLHSGSMLPKLMNAFGEPKPIAGGDEHKWIISYLKVRRDWLARHPIRILNKTVYRAECFLSEATRGNWDLGISPIVMNGTKVLAA